MQSRADAKRADADPDTHCDAYSNSYGDSHSDADCYIATVTNAHVDAFTDRQTYTDCATSS